MDSRRAAAGSRPRALGTRIASAKLATLRSVFACSPSDRLSGHMHAARSANPSHTPGRCGATASTSIWGEQSDPLQRVPQETLRLCSFCAANGWRRGCDSPERPGGALQCKLPAAQALQRPVAPLAPPCSGGCRPRRRRASMRGCARPECLQQWEMVRRTATANGSSAHGPPPGGPLLARAGSDMLAALCSAVVLPENWNLYEPWVQLAWLSAH